jgi:NAD(P)-dependent dehydrogenase (short-subunit alcohol dehydrogenase family)
MDYNIKGKIALITGGSHGIGKAVAEQLALEGCNISICARNADRLLETQKRIEQIGVKCLARECDVFDRQQCLAFVEDTVKEFRTIDILVNNVGGGGRWGSPDPLATPEKVWYEVYEKNVGAALRFTMACLPYMKAQNWGRIIAITSRYGIEIGGRPWFNIAKTAEHVLMKNLSSQKSIVRYGITFNSVAPGDIMIADTGWELEQKSNNQFGEMLDTNYPIGRLGTPEDVASVVSFLCSQQASYVNGSHIAVDGGTSRGI